MDTAVALVQAYLNLNGYFTVVEYPVLETSRRGPARSVTDLDVLAVRFTGAGHEVIRGHGHRPISGQFRGMSFPEQEIEVSGEVTGASGDELTLDLVASQNGSQVIRNATAVVTDG